MHCRMSSDAPSEGLEGRTLKRVKLDLLHADIQRAVWSRNVDPSKCAFSKATIIFLGVPTSNKGVSTQKNFWHTREDNKL